MLSIYLSGHESLHSPLWIFLVTSVAGGAIYYMWLFHVEVNNVSDIIRRNTIARM